jgi:N4-gp56 family major capsid protein
MAILDIQTTHNLTQQQWSNEMFKEHVEELYMQPFMGTGMKAPICVKMELEKSAGDKLTLPKSYLLNQESGVTGSTTLEGKEQDMEFGDQTLTAEETRNAVRFRLGLSDQRTSIDLRNNAREILLVWKTQETDDKVFSELSVTPTTNRELAADSTATHKAAVPAAGIDDIATTDIVTVKGIRKLKLHAITGNAGAAEKMKPYKEAKFGMQGFLLFLDPWSLQDLKADPDYVAYASEEGKGRAAFFNGGIVDIDGVIIIECDKIVREENAGSVMVARNLLIGAGAAAVNWAGASLMDGQRGHIQWSEKDFDYENQIGIALGDIKGVTKIRFNREDAGLQDDNSVIQFYSASISG